MTTTTTPLPTPAQFRMARYGLGLGVRDVVKGSKLSSTTITKIENDAPVNGSSLHALANFYRSLGVEFRDDRAVKVPEVQT